MTYRLRAALLLAASSVAALALAGCGGSSSPGAPDGGTVPIPTPAPTPTPSPTPSQPAACRLTAPTADCSTRLLGRQEMAEVLQVAIDTAVGTPGTMYGDHPNRVYNFDLFRSRVVDSLTAAGVCGAWDYGNELGDEIFMRSADGCVVEQYDVFSGAGGVRVPGKSTNLWWDGFGATVPGPKPQFSREGDLTCSLPGDRSTYCFSIKGTQGEFGPEVYRLLVEVMNENPALFDKEDFVPGQGEFTPDELRPAAWGIRDRNAFIAAVEKKLRASGFCAYVVNGDVLKVKRVAKGNVLHEEIDIVQDPSTGGSYVSFVVKDRCHNAGF